MEYAAEPTELHARIKRLEDQVKAFRFTVVIVSFLLGLQFWMQTRPKAITTTAIMRARQFDLVDEAGKTVGQLSPANGGVHLVLYNPAYQPAAEFSVVGSEPSIVLYDGEQKQRAILGLLAGEPTLAMHDAEGEVRALLTTDSNNSTFWIKTKSGFATILGSAVDETRTNVAGTLVPQDIVKITSGASIRIQDANRKILWKAP